MSLIGVKDLTLRRLQKRDLLFFDQIAVPNLDAVVSKNPDKSMAADLEWLVGQGVLFEANTDEAMNKLIDRGIGVPFHRYFWQAVIIISAIVRLREDKTPDDPLLSRGISNFFNYGLRCVALYVEQERSTRTVPIIDSVSDLDSEPRINFATAIENINRSKDVFWRKIQLLDDEGKEIARTAFDLYQYIVDSNLLRRCLFVGRDCPMVTRADTISVVLKALPFPDESVSLDRLIEFKNNDNTKKYLEDLRRWLRKLAKEGMSAMEIEEELQYLVSSYEDHMRFQKLKFRKRTIETLIVTPFEIAERILKIKWGDVAHGLFSLEQHRIDLMEAEKNAPGREVAYIIKARDQFTR